MFSQEEVLADAHKAMASHDGTVADSLVVERVDSESSSESVIESLCQEVFYPVHEDKDWLKKMTSQSQEAPTTAASRKRSISPASSAPACKRQSLRLYDKEKEKEREETALGDDDANFEPQEEVEPEQEMEQDPRSSSTEERSSPPVPSTSKKRKPLLTPKERFKGKVFQVTDMYYFHSSAAVSFTNFVFTISLPSTYIRRPP